MADYPLSPINKGIISTISPEGPGAQLQYGNTAFSAGAWPAANRAIFVPIRVRQPFFCGTQFAAWGAASGNFDLGIYTPDGTRLNSSGSTAVSGTTVQSVLSLQTLYPGLYYFALACDNTTVTPFKCAPTAQGVQILGIAQMASAFPLPATATFASPASSYVPLIGVTLGKVY